MSADTRTSVIRPSVQTLPLETARWRLALLWFPGSGLIFLILIAQSLGGAYGSELQRAWGWALPNFLPTLALMISVFAADAMRAPGETDAVVRRNFAFLALALSAFYLLVLFVSVAGQVIFMSYNSTDELVERRLTLLEISNYWLAPLQSLVVAAIGTLFFLKEENKSSDQTNEG